MHIDFETYSEAGYYWDKLTARWKAVDSNNPGIAGVGAWIYSIHPLADIISLSYDGKLWRAGDPPPIELFEHIKNGGLCWAWNSFFEYAIWNNVAVPLYEWPPLPLEQLRCSMARGRAWGLPGKLKDAGAALELDVVKDAAGGPLIRKLCCPRTPTKNNPLHRLTPVSNPEDFNRFYEYNRQDTQAEAAITQITPPLIPREEKLWLLDQKINTRGVHIDREGLNNCLDILHQAEKKYTEELIDITSGQVETANELDKMKDWLYTRGVATSSLDVDHVTALLDKDISSECKRVLQIRQILGSASVKKLNAIQRYIAPDNRIRGLFTYCGAERTGRFSGGGPQPHNMPAGGPPVAQCACGFTQWKDLTHCRKCGGIISPNSEADWGIDAAELALQDIATRDLSLVERNWGDPLTAISGCLRSLFTAAPGNDLIASDYSAIEAVVLACLAGEDWRVEVFRTHGKIYEMSAAKISGVPFDEILDHKKTTGQHHPLRKKIGKVAELASGYGGWIGAWKNFGADKHLIDDEMKQSILKWRDESPMIIEFWGGQYRGLPWTGIRQEFYGLEGAAVLAVQNPGQCYSYRQISYGVKDNVLYCRLPSGRTLAYHKPKLTLGPDRLGVEVWHLSFMGWNSNPLAGPVGWHRIETYSGKLTENVVQATARDILTHAMPLVEDAGYPIVLHVHDELCSEVPTGYGSIEEYELLMMRRPEWAADWPIKAAGGWRGKRYRK